MGIPVLVTIFGTLPQVFLLLYGPLGLVGVTLTLRRLIVPALLLTAIVSATRSVPALLGWHIPIFLFAYLGVSKLFNLTRPIAALASAALSFILVALGDAAVALPVLGVFGLKYDEIIKNELLHTLFVWVESLPLLIAALIVRFTPFVLIPIARLQRHKNDSGDAA